MFTGSYGTPRGRRTTAGAMDFNRLSPFMSSTMPPHNSATEQDSGLLGASRGTGAKFGGWAPSLCSSIYISYTRPHARRDN